MTQRKLTMRKSKEILRMKWKMGFSDRQVAASPRIAHSTVGDYRYLAESCENVRGWKQKIASVDTFSGLDQVLIENIFAIQEDIVPTNRADMFK